MLIDSLVWESHPVPATLASPSIGLSIGRVGTGDAGRRPGRRATRRRRAVGNARDHAFPRSDAARRLAWIATRRSGREPARLRREFSHGAHRRRRRQYGIPGRSPGESIRRGSRPSCANMPSTEPTSCSTCTAAAAGALIVSCIVFRVRTTWRRRSARPSCVTAPNAARRALPVTRCRSARRPPGIEVGGAGPERRTLGRTRRRRTCAARSPSQASSRPNIRLHRVPRKNRACSKRPPPRPMRTSAPGPLPSDVARGRSRPPRR